MLRAGVAGAVIAVVGGPVRDTSGRPAFGGSSVGAVAPKTHAEDPDEQNDYKDHALCVRLGYYRLLLRMYYG